MARIAWPVLVGVASSALKSTTSRPIAALFSVPVPPALLSSLNQLGEKLGIGRLA